jgi:hypothetical protein
MRKTIRELPAGFRLFVDRARAVPFEIALGLVSLWSGAISFFGITLGAQTLNATLPPIMVSTFNLMYLLAGVFIIAGVGWGYRNLEASGVILLATALIVRAVAVVIGVGISPTTVTLIFQAAVFSAACLLRLISLLKHEIVILAADIPVSTE